MNAQATVVLNRPLRASKSADLQPRRTIFEKRPRTMRYDHKKSEGLPRRQTFAIRFHVNGRQAQVERATSRFAAGLAGEVLLSPSNHSNIGEAINTVL